MKRIKKLIIILERIINNEIRLIKKGIKRIEIRIVIVKRKT